ncbi:MAG: YihY/virulence factor BrkB family protein [Lachnospiraceae bacterium]|nr:YihY/virulence factor BrkB family protein [Lachnospiraceae bacterium]
MVEIVAKVRRDFQKRIGEDHISAYASSTAFFTFLSLFPMILMILSILPYTPLQQETILVLLAKVFPDSMYHMIGAITTDLYGASRAMLPITLIVTLWSAAKGTLALTRGLNVIYEVTERRNYIILRLRACLYTVAMLAIILILLVGLVFAYKIRDILILQMPGFKFLFEFLVAVRFVFVLGFLTILFTTLYTYLPNRKNLFYLQIPGALFTACSWYFISWIFSVYVNAVNVINLYGSLSTVVVAMLWMYFIFHMVFVGGAVNCSLERYLMLLRSRKRKKSKKVQPKQENLPVSDKELNA